MKFRHFITPASLVFCLHTAASALPPTAVDLSLYVRTARHNLPEPTRTTAPANSALCEEASAVTYNWDTNTLFVIGDEGTSVVQVSKTGALIDSMTLAQGAFPDTEGLAYVGGGKFVLTEERTRKANRFTYVAGGTLTVGSAESVTLGTLVGNVGIEGLSYDTQTTGFIFVKEKDPQSIFQTTINFSAGTASNGSASTTSSTNLFSPALANVADFSDVFSLSNVPTLTAPDSGNLLLLSQESGQILEIARDGTIASTLTLTADPTDTLPIPDMTIEGVTMDNDGKLYVVNENGGGSPSFPQLWVYEPSSATNLAPTAVALTNTVTTIPENTSTAAAIKVADIAVTDDGLGANGLAIIGADASSFQIIGAALYLKPGTVLSQISKPSYSVSVNVDDITVGSTPDATTASFTLTVSAPTSGTATVIISEVTPWGSGSHAGSLAADWFEVTNVGTATANISGWKVDDSSNAFASSLALNGVTSIAPGESVIFIESSAPITIVPAFKTRWFGANPPANLQIGTYTGNGIGLSTGGDAVSLYNSSGTLQANVTFGVASAGPTFLTFDNAAGLNNAAVSQLSADGVSGAFVATNATTEIGSPGTIGASSAPIISITATDANAAETATDSGTFRISHTGSTIGNQTVNFTVSTGAGQALASDYTPTLTGVATIVSGQSFVDVTITPVDDALLEGSETVTLTLGDTGSYDVGTPASATVTIADNEVNNPPSAVALSNTVPAISDITSTASAIKVADISVTDLDGLGTNTLSLTGADASAFQITGSALFLKVGTSLNYSTKPSYAVTVNVDDATVGITPDASVNFTLALTPGSLVITEVYHLGNGNGSYDSDWFEVTNNGASDINISGWKMDDNSNSFATSVALRGTTTIPAGRSVIFIEGDATGTNDAAKAAAFSSAWFGTSPTAGLTMAAYGGSGVGFGNSGDAVNLFDAAGNRVTGVAFGTAPTKTTFDNRTAGLGSTTLPLPVLSTASVVGVNGAFVSVSGAETGSPGVSPSAPIGTSTVSIAAAAVAEGNSGTTTLNLLVTRTNTSSAFTVNYAVTGGTAASGTDFTLASGTLSFGLNGAATQNIAITVNGETAFEFDETITVTLSNIVNANGTTTLGTAAGTGTITNDDSPIISTPSSNTNRDITLPNTDTWPATGVNVGGTQFINLGLQGIGRLPASSIDPATGETLGSISDMQISNWVKNANGSFSGTLSTLPDRGYNSTTIFSNYAARINDFTFTFTPYTGTSAITAQNQIALSFAGSSRFTYDHDANSNTAPVFTTGLVADGAVSLFGTTVPVRLGATTQSDGTVTNRLTVDSEGLILDKRPGKGGAGWVGDEYGAYIYHFNASKQIDGQLQLPAALIPHATVGGPVSFNATPVNIDGRRINQGMEGIAQSPAGTKIFGLMQSATMQDSINAQQTRLNTRLVVYDISSSDTPSAPSAQYVIQLPRIDSTGSTTNGATVDRTGAQSSIIALNDHQLLILSRDGNGRGATGSPVFKSILLADLTGATNINGLFDSAGSAVAPGGVLDVSVTPLTWTEALNMIGKLDLPIAEVAKFGLNLNAAPGDMNSISEKWEALSFVSAKDPANPNDYFLFVGNDNDFQTAAGKLMDAAGIIQDYNAGLENDTMVLAYRVRLVSSTLAPTFNTAATAGLSATANNSSPINLFTAAAPTPAGGTFSGPGVSGNTFDPAVVAAGVHSITYSYTDSFGTTQSATFNITVSAAPAISVTPTNALSVSHKSSINLTGGAEIPAFHPASKRAYAASPNGVEVVDMTNPSAPVRLTPIDTSAAPYSLGTKDVSHVIVKGNVLAVSLVATLKTNPGTVAFLDAATGALLGSVAVGAVPDQLVFTPDGMKVLVANEGELALAPGADPDGSVSIIDVSGGFPNTAVVLPVQTATFAAFNGQETAMRASGIRVFPGNSATKDLEPEYIAISADGTTAMVTLQEANAVAILNIPTATFTDIKPLGLKNYSTLLADFSDRDSATNGTAIELKNLPAFGMFMPDGISSYQASGQTYYVTANEGDDRNDFLATPDVVNVNSASYDLDNTVFPTEGVTGTNGPPATSGSGLKGNDQLGRLQVANLTGLRGDLDNDGDIDRILSLGSRSFSILDASGNRVFDSGDLIDRVLTSQYPFLYDDTRSDNKSAEPEGVAISVIGGKTYAFVGLERAHSVMIFDVTDPANVTFTTLANRTGDLNPEGMLLIPATDSPTGTALLLVASEVSNTLTTFEVIPESAPVPMQLQVLHFYGESGLLGIQTAPIMGAMIDKFNDNPNTVVIGEGDSFIPGPWLVAGADPTLNTVLHTASTGSTGGAFTSAANTTAVPLGQADIAIMNAFGITVSALGNHEFDLGSPVLQGAISSALSQTLGNWEGAQFPHITANLNFAADSSLRGLADVSSGGSAVNTFRGLEVTTIQARIAPYAIKTIAGQKIGFVGATTFELLSKSSPNGTIPLDDANGATSDLQEVAAYVQGAVNALQALGVNKIIMVDQLDDLQRNKDLAPLLTGVDIMVAGGGHERMGDATDTAVAFNGHDANFIADTYPIVTAGADTKPTLIVTTDTEYSYLGRLVVDFNAAGEINTGTLNTAVNGAYASSAGILEAVYSNGQTAAQIIAASPMATRVQNIVTPINNIITTKEGNVFGYTNVYLEGDRVFGRTQEVNLGNITADANAAAARAALGLGVGNAIFSLKNGGGIRASIGAVTAGGAKIPPLAIAPPVNKPANAISQLDIENALRFDNKLMVFNTTPAGLRNILEFAAGLSSGPTNQNGGYAQVGNIRFSYNSALASGSRLRSAALVNEAGVSLAKIIENGTVVATAPPVITCVSLNFTANGGDSYPIKANASNFRYLTTAGGVSAAVDASLDLTATATMATVGLTQAQVLGEQKVFQDFLVARHPSLATAYNAADTAVALDTRIQQLAFRTDTIPSGTFTYSGYLAAGATNTDSDGLSLLEEYAFGLNPGLSDSSAININVPAGTLAARGTPTIYSAPTQAGQDFRFVFIRVRNAASVGITYTPQFSNDMTEGTWENRADLPAIVIATSGDYEAVSVDYPFFTNGKKARFARMAISTP